MLPTEILEMKEHLFNPLPEKAAIVDQSNSDNI